MAYNPKHWVCGETISADDMNRIENGIRDAEEACCLPELDGASEGMVLTVSDGHWQAEPLPEVPTELPAVTSEDDGDVLTVVDGEWAKASSGGGDCGFECREETVLTTIAEENVHFPYVSDAHYEYVEQVLDCATPITADTLIVTFDGVEYEVPKLDTPLYDGESDYGELENGAMSFDTYPFFIVAPAETYDPSYPIVIFAAFRYEDDTVSVKIETAETVTVAITTPCFDVARGYSCTEEPSRETLMDDDVYINYSSDYDYPTYYMCLDETTTPITADSLFVTFNGVEYEVPRSTDQYDPTISVYEQLDEHGNLIFEIRSTAEVAPDPETTVCIVVPSDLMGTTVSLKLEIESTTYTVTTTPCFEEAVRSVAGGGGLFVINVTETPWYDYESDKTFAEITQALSDGKVCVVNGSFYGNTGVMFSLVEVTDSSYKFSHVDAVANGPNGQVSYFAFVIASDDSVTFIENTVKGDGSITLSGTVNNVPANSSASKQLATPAQLSSAYNITSRDQLEVLAFSTEDANGVKQWGGKYGVASGGVVNIYPSVTLILPEIVGQTSGLIIDVYNEDGTARNVKYTVTYKRTY